MKREPLPSWFKVPLPGGARYIRVRGMLHGAGLHTVCEEARCPNIGECFEQGTATFLLLGRVCTRRCRFCAVEGGRPQPPDPLEAEKVAQAVVNLGLDYAVLTSVTRDDLPDGGAGVFARTVIEIRKRSPGCRVEALIPDFRGSPEALEMVAAAGPHILNHNIETVPRLYPVVRPQADYRRSLELLKKAGEMGLTTKSGIMLGLGETWGEVLAVLADLREGGCSLLTLGQYLAPSPHHLPVARFYHPKEFARLKEEAEKLGFTGVEAGPLVRSSYHARRQFQQAIA